MNWTWVDKYLFYSGHFILLASWLSAVVGCSRLCSAMARSSPPPTSSTFSFHFCPYTRCSLLPHDAISSMMVWSSNRSYTICLPFCASNCPSFVIQCMQPISISLLWGFHTEGELLLWPGVQVPTLRVAGMGITPCFSLSSHTSDFNIDTLVTTLPGTWHWRISARTGWPGTRFYD